MNSKIGYAAIDNVLSMAFAVYSSQILSELWKSRGLPCGCVGLCFLYFERKIKMENKEQNLTVGSVPQKADTFCVSLIWSKPASVII